MELIQNFMDIYYGGIYNQNYQQWSDGGPECYNSSTIFLRVSQSLLSVIINVILIIKLKNIIKNSRELDLSLVQDLNPSKLERLCGLTFFITYIIQSIYKMKSGRLIFMHNPCHYLVLISGILMTTKKTKFNAILYIIYQRFIFGALIAIVFPDLEGLDFLYEKELFFIEHYQAGLQGPLFLMLFGRYGFFRQSLKVTLAQQFFGFGFFSLYQRLILLPQSLITQANLNFTLCYSKTDPFIPLFGNYYMYFADHYLNLSSFIAIHFIYGVYIILNGILSILRKLFFIKTKND